MSESDIVYQILTDRFFDGNPSNNDQGKGEYMYGNLKFYQGGDWQGIIDKIDYIKNLGVTAIWISPVSDNEDLSRDESSAGYHGYWTHDFYSPDPHFGTKTDLSNLISTCHARGIKVILDVVPNHSADYLAPRAAEYDPPDYCPAPPFNDPSWYHSNGDITDWNDQWQLENCDVFGLDDLAQEKREVGDELCNCYRQWFLETNADAARVDCAKHMPKSFLSQLETSIGEPTIGEVYSGDVSYVADYQNYEWGVTDYPLYYTIDDVFAKGGSCYGLRDRLDQDSSYPNPNRLLTFVDNHDQVRFLRRTSPQFDWDRLKLSLTFIMSLRGIPCIYYGTEQGYAGVGNADYENRENLQDWNQQHELYQFIKKLTSIRKDHGALSEGTYYEMWVDDEVFSYLRKDGSDEVIIVLNNANSGQTRTIPIRTESSLAVGTILVNQLNPNDKVLIFNQFMLYIYIPIILIVLHERT
jgi:glycosidase